MQGQWVSFGDGCLERREGEEVFSIRESQHMDTASLSIPSQFLQSTLSSSRK